MLLIIWSIWGEINSGLDEHDIDNIKKIRDFWGKKKIPLVSHFTHMHLSNFLLSKRTSICVEVVT